MFGIQVNTNFCLKLNFFLGKLPATFYSGTMTNADLDPKEETKYKWGFAKSKAKEANLDFFQNCIVL